jgi:hypothetical protein
VPRLNVGSSIGIGLSDSIAVAHTGGPSIAQARVAPGRPSRVLAGRPVALVGSAAVISVSSNHPVSVSGKPPAGGTPDAAAPSEPAPEAVPTPPAASQPTQSGPIVIAEIKKGLGGSGGGTGGPRTAGGVVRGGLRSGVGPIPVVEGHEYVLAFSFEIEESVFEQPGTENLLLRVLSEGAEVPALGLQLWEFPGSEWYSAEVARGLWSSGSAMGGERFLAPLSADAWHELAIHFTASSEASGFYEVFLDGVPIDARSGVSLIAPEGASTQIEAGLFREGERVPGTSDVRFGGAKLTETSEPDLP